MDKPDFNRVLRIALLQQSKMQYLTLAAGTSSGESFILGNALKKVVERHYPRIRLTVIETGGTVENLRMLENGRAQLADAQSDILPGPRARVLAVLYDDAFRLLVSKNSQFQSLADLQGHRIALAQSGVARHYIRCPLTTRSSIAFALRWSI
jgi:uncharacterized protein